MQDCPPHGTWKQFGSLAGANDAQGGAPLKHHVCYKQIPPYSRKIPPEMSLVTHQHHSADEGVLPGLQPVREYSEIDVSNF